METEHATNEVIARANVLETGSNDEQKAIEPRILNLYLDVDGKYRWYDQEKATQAEGDRIHSALAAGRVRWPGFEVVEVRGRAITTPEEVEDYFASDELQAVQTGSF